MEIAEAEADPNGASWAELLRQLRDEPVVKLTAPGERSSTAPTA